MFEGGETSGLTVNTVLNYTLIAEPIAQFASIFMVRYFGRKTILIIYAFSVALMDALLAFFDLTNTNVPIVVVLIALLFAQDCFGVPVLGLYAIEVTNNASLGMLQLYTNIFMSIVGFMMPYLIRGVSVPILYFVFAGITFLHGVYIIFVIKETAHLTDKEKKEVYAPKKNE